jgi:hypothetical protein
MGHITFLIGNGFDLNVGLKTRYADFYEIYTTTESSSTVIQRFKDGILQSKVDDWKDWKDFELGMGQQSSQFGGENSTEDFIECVDDFVVHFNQYLLGVCNTVVWDSINDKLKQTFTQSIHCFYDHVRTIVKNDVIEISGIGGNQYVTATFLQFNYTYIFDYLLAISDFPSQMENTIHQLEQNLHIHGTIGGGHLTIGVNDKTQITSEQIRNDPDVQNTFIKQNFLDILQNRNVNTNIRETALSAIDASSVICAFGVSIGDTDKYWWKKIGEWLDCHASGIFVIFDICGTVDDGISRRSFLRYEEAVSRRRAEIIDRFIRLADLEPEWAKNHPNRIIVELNSSMFQFKLPMSR